MADKTTSRLFDHITLAGVESPGVCKITGASRPEKWEVTEADGQSGASVTNKGGGVAKFSISFFLWHEPGQENHFTGWVRFRELFALTRGESARALDIYHPDLALLGIASVVIENEGQIVHDGKGGATVQVDFLEFRKPKKKAAVAIAGAQGSIGGATAGLRGAFEPDPNADLKAQLALDVQAFKDAPQELKELQSLRGEIESVFE